MIGYKNYASIKGQRYASECPNCGETNVTQEPDVHIHCGCFQCGECDEWVRQYGECECTKEPVCQHCNGAFCKRCVL